jgi:hypothetical protein
MARISKAGAWWSTKPGRVKTAVIIAAVEAADHAVVTSAAAGLTIAARNPVGNSDPIQTR